MSYLSFSDTPGFDIYADRGPHLVRVCSVMIALSAIAVALRFVSRGLSKVRLWWDDWLILVALVNDLCPILSRSLRLTPKKPLAWIPSILMIHCKNHVYTRVALVTKIDVFKVCSISTSESIYSGPQPPISGTFGSTFTRRESYTQYLWSSSNARYCRCFTAYFTSLLSNYTLRRLGRQSSSGG